MRIQNNIMAMNTHRFYTMNNNAVSKAAEKLSSGYRVNRAGDDAAGLAISEKMRAEIRGLSMASKNSQDGVSMVQTAEGALTEVQSMLQRMKELAVQAASDSNENDIDRPALDQEFQQLLTEIDDVAKTTTFNDMKLLDGSFQKKVIQIGSRTGNEMDISIGKMSAYALGLRKTEAEGFAEEEAVATAKASDPEIADATVPTKEGEAALTVDLTDGSIAATVGGEDVTVTDTDGIAAILAGKEETAVITADEAGTYNLDVDGVSIDIEVQEGSTVADVKAAIEGISYELENKPETSLAATMTLTGAEANTTGSATGSDTVAALTTTLTFNADNLKGVAAEDGDQITFTAEGNDIVMNIDGEEVARATAAAMTGATGTDTATQTLSFKVGGKEVASLKIDAALTALSNGESATAASIATAVGSATAANDEVTVTNNYSIKDNTVQDTDPINTEDETDPNYVDTSVNDGINLLTQRSASDTIDLCRDALNKVSTQRAALGAIQNRLEHKITNLDNTVENVSAAESRIRDVDIAKEMTNFTKNQILSQAATAMLAQANSLPQGVLSLLQ